MARILAVLFAILVCAVPYVNAAQCTLNTNVDAADTDGTGTPICSTASGSSTTVNNDGASCFVSCAPHFSDSVAGTNVDISVTCSVGGSLSPIPTCTDPVCDTTPTSGTVSADITASGIPYGATCPLSRSSYISAGAACPVASLSSDYWDFSTSPATQNTGILCQSGNTFVFNSNVKQGCNSPAASYSATGVISTGGSCSNPVAGGSTCTVNTDTAHHYYSLTGGTTWASSTTITCPATGGSFTAGSDSIVLACDAPPTSSLYAHLDNTQGTCSTVSGTAPLAVTGTCTVGTDTTNYYYNFASGSSSTTVTASCGAAGGTSYTDGGVPTAVIAQGCVSPPTAVDGLTTGFTLGSSATSTDCGFASTSAAIKTTTSCNIATNSASHYYNFATVTSPTTTVVASCQSAPATYTSADSGNVAFGCYGQAATTSDVTGTGNTNLDVAATGSGYCASLDPTTTPPTVLKAGDSAHTCKIQTAAHYYNFAVVASPTTNVDAFCTSGATSNKYTLTNSPVIAGGCDSLPTDGTLSATSGSFGTGNFNYANTAGTCANVLGTPIPVGASTCTIATNTGKYQFAGATGTNIITAGCSAINTYSFTGTANVAAGCGVWSTSAVTGLTAGQISGSISSSNNCASLTVTSAIAVNAACTIDLASNYRDFTTPSSPSTSTPAKCSAADAFTATNSANVKEACTVPPTTSSFASVVAAAINTAGGTTGYCNQVGSIPIAVGQTCKVALATSYFDSSSGSQQSYFTATCATGNTWTTTATTAPASTPTIQQYCNSAVISGTGFETNVASGTSANCGGFVLDGATCVATCGGGNVVDPALITSAGTSNVPVYKCTASSNTLALQTVVSSNICVAAGCQAPPALNEIYDFTAGTNACSLVSVTNRITSGGTCTLQCKGNTFPKGNVAPTFTCDSTTQTLLPTNYDICVPGSNLPVTMFVKGTVLPS